MDAMKGLLAVVLASTLILRWFNGAPHTDAQQWYAICAGVCAILGHNYTCWLYFKGGKGIATSAGVLLALVPGALVIIFAVWVLVFALTRYVSLASICASATLPFAAWITRQTVAMILITAGLAALAIYKHRGNIKRLLKGTESRFGRPKDAAAAEKQ